MRICIIVEAKLKATYGLQATHQPRSASLPEGRQDASSVKGKHPPGDKGRICC